MKFIYVFDHLYRWEFICCYLFYHCFIVKIIIYSKRYVIAAPVNKPHFKDILSRIKTSRRLNIELDEADTYETLLPDEVFDLILLNNSIYTLVDWKKAIAKARLQLREVCICLHIYLFISNMNLF